jgi:adenosine deaminase
MRALRELPKAHLHLHLEAAMRPSTLAELGEQHGVHVPDMSSFATFGDFIKVYDVVTDCLRTGDDLRRLIREMAEDAAADGAVWLEYHVYPALWLGRFGSDEEALDLTLALAREAEEATGVGLGAIVAIDRTHGLDEAVRTAEMAASRAGRGVVALGLANDETGRPPEPFAEAFAIGREAGLLSVPHAGELGGPDYVRGAVEVLHADRVGHGVRGAEDPDVVRLLADEGVVCDVCPTSNLLLGLFPSMRDHAISRLVEAGVRVTINTDDPLLFGPGLFDEYRTVQQAFGWDDEVMAGIARTSIEASGAPPDRRSSALAAIDAWLAG